MRHVTRYRIYPSQNVAGRLFTGFARCSFVRTWCLENRVYRDSCLPKLKTEYPELKEVHSKVLQNVVQQIAHNLKALRAESPASDEGEGKNGRQAPEEVGSLDGV